MFKEGHFKTNHLPFLEEANLIFLLLKKLSLKYFSLLIYKTLKKIDGMGLGDAKLMAGIGLLFGWQSIPLVLFLSSILGLFFVAPSLLKKQKTMKSEIPFGPFIIIAMLIYFVFGDFFYDLILV